MKGGAGAPVSATERPRRAADWELHIRPPTMTDSSKLIVALVLAGKGKAREEGLRLVVRGVTSVDELMRVVK